MSEQDEEYEKKRAEIIKRNNRLGLRWWRPRAEPTTYQKCLAVHMHYAENKGKLSE